MIKSMTGYGKVDYEDQCLRISVEVKSINARYADISLRLPNSFSAQEIVWRNLAMSCLERGKIVLSLAYDYKNAALLPQTHINQALFKKYYHTLQSIAEEVGASSEALFQLAMQLPEVITNTGQDIGYKEALQVFEKVIQAALQQCDQSRQIEGAVLATKLLGYLKGIKESLKKIEKLDPDRSNAVREKLHGSVQTLIATHAIDAYRLEQEIVYYLERLDITEEKVRLGQHLSYFEEVMKTPQAAGKKLGFIAQEIGREINTIGAKANNTAIQKEVILMKGELEKIKEQLQNIL
jgi:uncharacterized protein (TIGR00255 family)